VLAHQEKRCYYSAVGLALRAAVANVSGVQRGAALVGEAPHPSLSLRAAPSGVLRLGASYSGKS
jgi:hypothetical protein